MHVCIFACKHRLHCAKYSSIVQSVAADSNTRSPLQLWMRLLPLVVYMRTRMLKAPLQCNAEVIPNSLAVCAVPNRQVLQAFVQAVGAVPKALRSVAAQAPQASLSGLMGLAAGAATGPRVMRASHEASVHELQGLAADVASLPQIWHQQQLG